MDAETESGCGIAAVHLILTYLKNNFWHILKFECFILSRKLSNEEFLEDSGITQTALAKALGLTQPRVNELIQGRRRLTADDALRLSRFFGTDAQFWMNTP